MSHGDRDTVATNVRACFVGDSESRFTAVQALVDGLRELVQRTPAGLLVTQLAVLARPHPFACFVACPVQELDVAPLYIQRSAGTLEDFNQAFDGFVAAQRNQKQQEAGRISRLVAACVGRHDDRVALGQSAGQQPAMASFIVATFRQFGHAHVDLRDQFDSAPFARSPDSAAGCRQSRYHRGEELLEVVLHLDILLGEHGNVAHQALDFFPGLLQAFSGQRIVGHDVMFQVEKCQPPSSYVAARLSI